MAAVAREPAFDYEENDGTEVLPELNPKQQEVARIMREVHPGNRAIVGYGGGMGGGKFQPYESLVYTPFGPKQMGDLKVGDQVCSPDGGVQRVIAVHEQGEQDVYRVTFTDGASTLVGLDHLWFVKLAAAEQKADRRWPHHNERVRGRVMTTEEMWSWLKKAQASTKYQNGKGGLPPWPLVPLVEPVQFTTPIRNRWGLMHPVDPYLLGALLGDGSIGYSSVVFTNVDPECIGAVRAALPDGELVQAGHPKNWRVRNSSLKAKLTSLGLWGHTAANKFIPSKYKVSPLAVRWSLMQGLMDTDGYVDNRGHCSYTTISETLAEDIRWIVRSLGFKATITSKDPFYRDENGERVYCNKAFTVYIQGRNTRDLFRLARKRDRCRDEFNGGASEPMRRVVEIEFEKRTPCRCITVDHPAGLYITDDFIVTHNSYLLARMGMNLSLSFPGNRILIGRQTLESLKTTTMEHFFNICPRSLIAKHNQSENWVQVRNPAWPPNLFSKIFFRGLEDYEKKGSEQYGAILIDEAHEVAEKAARYFTTRLRHQLPKAVREMMARQCRVCGGMSRTDRCAIHGETIGNGLRYYFLCGFNPWPGWTTDWFWRRQLPAIEQLSGASLHFVQALPKDNPHNDDGAEAGAYEAWLRATLTPDEVRRFVEGQFDVFAGLVYEAFRPEVHKWAKTDIPKYTRVIGGLDFGGESSKSSHFSSGIVAVVTESGHLIRVAEFKYRGPDVADKQLLWMMKMEEEWAKPIQKRISWRADRSQMVGIQFWRNKLGFNITYSKGGPDSVDEGIKAVARRLNIDPQTKLPGSFYLPSLTQWEAEMREYRRDPDNYKIIKVNDDLVDADRYMEELMGVTMGDPGQLFRNQLPIVF